MEFAGVDNHDDFYSFDCDETSLTDDNQTPNNNTAQDRKPPNSYITAAPTAPQVGKRTGLPFFRGFPEIRDFGV